MSMLVWVMMGIAVWHFTVFVPDRFWGGIVGAFLAASIAAALFGLLVNGGTIPGQSDTDIIQALIAIPGSVIGLGALVLVRRTRRPPARHRPRPDARRLALSWPAPGAPGRTARACGRQNARYA